MFSECVKVWASVEGYSSEKVCMSDSSGAAEKHLYEQSV